MSLNSNFSPLSFAAIAHPDFAVKNPAKVPLPPTHPRGMRNKKLQKLY